MEVDYLMHDADDAVRLPEVAVRFSLPRGSTTPEVQMM
jgi:hypothetical protein